MDKVNVHMINISNQTSWWSKDYITDHSTLRSFWSSCVCTA